MPDVNIDFSEEIAAIIAAKNNPKNKDAYHTIQKDVARKLGVEGTVEAVKIALGLSPKRSSKSIDEILEMLIKISSKAAPPPAENPAPKNEPAEKTLTERLSILEAQNKKLEERVKRLEKIVADNKNLEERLDKLERVVGV